MPSGRFDVLFYPQMLKLHGKSSDYTVPLDNITSMFMLPSPEGAWCCMVLQLSTPLRRGQTKYPSVIIQVDDRRDMDVELNLTPDQLEELKTNVPELRQNMSSIEYELAGLLLRALCKKPMIGASTFRGAGEDPCFRCSHKVESGLFYPLDDYFVFVPKPVIIVR